MTRRRPSLTLKKAAEASGGSSRAGAFEKEDSQSARPTSQVSIGIMFGIIFLGMSIGMVALIIVLISWISHVRAVSPNFVDEFTDVVNKRQFKQAYKARPERQLVPGHVLSSRHGPASVRLEDAREADGRHHRLDQVAKESSSSSTCTVSTLGPLLGLVGTVSGMVGVPANSAPSSRPQCRRSGRQRLALVVTLVGVASRAPRSSSTSSSKSSGPASPTASRT